MTVAQLTGMRPGARAYSIRLGSTTGWDIWAAGDSDEEVVAHLEDWHRLERALVRLGHPAFAVEVRLSDDLP